MNADFYDEESLCCITTVPLEKIKEQHIHREEYNHMPDRIEEILCRELNVMKLCDYDPD